jgi:hypothetical protein
MLSSPTVFVTITNYLCPLYRNILSFIFECVKILQTNFAALEWFFILEIEFTIVFLLNFLKFIFIQTEQLGRTGLNLLPPYSCLLKYSR